MFSHYNLKKGGEARFSTGNSIFLAVVSYTVYKVMVDWIKVLKVCVSKRHSLMEAVPWVLALQHGPDHHAGGQGGRQVLHTTINQQD